MTTTQSLITTQLVVQCTLGGAAFEDNSQVATAAMKILAKETYYTKIILSLPYRLSECFSVQFKILVQTYENLYCIALGFNCLAGAWHFDAVDYPTLLLLWIPLTTNATLMWNLKLKIYHME